jgi:hypothetical protein
MQAAGNHIRLGEIRNANSRLRGLLTSSLTALADDIGARLLSVMPYLGPWSLMAAHVVVPTFSCTLASTRHAWRS